jgi:hypothetical protein
MQTFFYEKHCLDSLENLDILINFLGTDSRKGAPITMLVWSWTQNIFDPSILGSRVRITLETYMYVCDFLCFRVDPYT